jgi:hypothetical protein
MKHGRFHQQEMVTMFLSAWWFGNVWNIWIIFSTFWEKQSQPMV